jgi:hypothetical protein
MCLLAKPHFSCKCHATVKKEKKKGTGMEAEKINKGGTVENKRKNLNLNLTIFFFLSRSPLLS